MDKTILSNKYKSKSAMDELNKTPVFSAKNKSTNMIIGHVRAKSHAIAKSKALSRMKETRGRISKAKGYGEK